MQHHREEVLIVPRVIHFELVSNNPEATQKFYEEIFGWKAEKWEGPMEYWFLTTGDPETPGIDGAFGRRRSPEDVAVDTIGVDDIDRHVRLIKDNGGEIVRSKSAVPGVGWLVYFKDTEGNLWGMMQDDPAAK